MRMLAAALTGLAMVFIGGVAPPSVMTTPPGPVQAVEGEDSPVATPHVDRVRYPDSVLGSGWQVSSDRAVTSAGDATGLHVLVAERSDAYHWRTAATLAIPGIEADQWVGQLCVTGSGRRAVVVYAPRTFTNRAVLMAQGAFSAVVDLDTGDVTRLPERVTLAYFNPTCGAGEVAMLSRLEESAEVGVPAKTWLGVVDTQSARVSQEVYAQGQLTSAVPVAERIVAVKGYGLVEVDADGEVHELAQLGGQPFRLLPDGDSGLAFQVARGDSVDLARLAHGRVRTVATAPLGSVKLRPGAGGEVFVAGARASQRVGRELRAPWRVIDALPDSDISTEGKLVVERSVTGWEAAGRLALGPADEPIRPVRIVARLADSQTVAADPLGFTVEPAVTASRTELAPRWWGGPAAGSPDDGGGVMTDPSTVPWDPIRACAVPRNHPEIQVYQPSAEQVEWAANLAVRGQLDVQRPANWLNSGLPSYSPQGYFSPLSLSGGGNVPAQIYLGVLAQESNLWQASWRVVDAMAGNALNSSGFYGIHWENPDPTTIDWSQHDCGYGAAQLTTGMHMDDTDEVVNGVLMTYTKQKAAVIDYATNIAAGLRILQSKWNETRNAGLIANDGNPQYLENWWLAIWAYNTGFYPDQGGGQPWGLGWSNNPASPLYPADRQMFLTAPLDHPDVDPPDQVGYDNAKHPNHWSYPERVIGWAYHSLIRWDYESQSYDDTYLPAEFTISTSEAQPDTFTFCVEQINECDPDASYEPGDFPGYPPGPCLRDDLMCWWNTSVDWLPPGWQDCGDGCGVEDRRFTTVEPRPLASSIYSAQCSTAGLPQSAEVITTIDHSSAVGPNGCVESWTDGGTFDLRFDPYVKPDSEVIYPAKVDLHQIGGGFGGHFFFAHSHSDANTPMKVTGTYTPAARFDGWVRVLVHLPDHGARTQQAHYRIHTGNSRYGDNDGVVDRYIPMRRMEHSWINLGTYEFDNSGEQYVELSNITQDGLGLDNVTWDALAFVPFTQKPDHFVVAIGDSYISGEGAGDYYVESDNNHGTYRWNACRRSKNAWPRQLILPGSGDSIGELADTNTPTVDLQFVACSGARANQLLATSPPSYWSHSTFEPDASGQNREINQLESGVLTSDTTLVLLSIGGNDAGFGDVITECALTSCASPQREQEIRQQLSAVQSQIRQVIDTIHAKAENATIVLAGYPMLFSEDIYSDPLHVGMCEITILGVTFGFTEEEAMMLNSLAHDFRDFQKQTVLTAETTGIDVMFVDLANRFGSHGVCPSAIGGSEEKINFVVLGPNGDGDDTLPSRESFHPKVSGQLQYAGAIADRLACADSCAGMAPGDLSVRR